MMAVVARADNLTQALDTLRVSSVTALLAGSSSRFRAAGLLHIRLAIFTFVMSPLIIACSICHGTTSLIACAAGR
jgi:hypothetical protein